MTILTRKEGPGAKSLIVCDNCGEEEERLTCTIKKSKLHFCDAECKIEYQTNKKRGSYRKSVNDIEYRTDRGNERKDAKLKIQDKVKKRCLACGRIYSMGPQVTFLSLETRASRSLGYVVAQILRFIVKRIYMDKQSKEQESQNRIDSIIALIMEEAESVKKNPNSYFQNDAECIQYVLMKVRERAMEIMRTMRE